VADGEHCIDEVAFGTMMVGGQPEHIDRLRADLDLVPRTDLPLRTSRSMVELRRCEGANGVPVPQSTTSSASMVVGSSRLAALKFGGAPERIGQTGHDHGTPRSSSSVPREGVSTM